MPKPVTTTRLAILSFLPIIFWFADKSIEFTSGKNSADISYGFEGLHYLSSAEK
ncbi:conserved hypothetical protein [delta proteobacterium NaphS2]|nr:conserved hypothetical protein [delta proteobacterium NaphS2]